MEVVVIGPSTRLGQNFNPGTSNNHYPAASQPAIGYPGRDGAAMHAAPPAGGGRSQNPPPPRREPTPSGDVCRLLSLLADKTRLRILKILAGGERPVVALTAELRLPQPTVSHHLAWLRMMDLVSPRRQGKHVYYALGAAAHWEENGVLTLTADDATVTITPNRQA
jgi:DNA-binding transcriptional ArsR family regulator